MASVGQKIEFQIDHIDTLGQGVHKEGEKITFIAKTLPGETGTARVQKSKKGVAFAIVEEFKTTAKIRIEPGCPHYSVCPGCDYLHTDYKSELSFKRAALDKLLARFPISEENLEIVSAPRRSSYRNRIQLHYKKSEIGFIDGLQNKLVEVPDCRVIQDELRPALKMLYEDKSWTETYRGNGHCELYQKDDELKQNWNQPYASGGFSQVFDEMNKALRQAVLTHLPLDEISTVLDLFSGDGNLSELIIGEHNIERMMVDYDKNHRQEDDQKNFIHLDLFSESALKSFSRSNKNKQFELLLLDPPRRGFNGLTAWVEHCKPNHLLYVSCNPASLARDLGNLNGKFSLDHLMLLDLFPGTHHFETVAFLTLK